MDEDDAAGDNAAGDDDVVDEGGSAAVDEETLTAGIGETDVDTLTGVLDPDEDEGGHEGGDESTEAADHDSDNEDVNMSRWSSDDATSYLFEVKTRHCVSDTAFEALWNGFRKVLPILAHRSAGLPSAKTLKRAALRDLPPFRVDVAYVDNVTKEVIELEGLEQVPKKRFQDRSKYSRVYEVWRAKLADVVTFHHALHEDEEKDIVLNIDGVPIGRTGKSQTIVSVKFLSCRSVYQVTNAIPFGGDSKKYLSVARLLGTVLASITDLGLTLKYICADAPMRSFLRNQKAHTAKLGCDYCYGKATHQNRPIWGLDTMNCEDRTWERVQEDYAKVAAREARFADYGYNGRSEVLDYLPHFDIVQCIPVDPMHLLYLGVARAMFELLFAVGDTRPTNLNDAPLQKTKKLDDAMAHVKVPTEFPRRPRAVDFKNWKASEWRNLVLVYFPIVGDILKPGIRRSLWLKFIYLCRAYSLDDDYFESLDVTLLKSLAQSWYQEFFAAFGPLNMRYNVHLMLHLARVRLHGAFPNISAFPFEGSFAANSRGQHVGTSSIGLQSMRFSYLRPKGSHTCEKKIKFTAKTTSRRQDDMVYSKWSCYQIAEEPESSGPFLKVKKVNVTTYFPPDGALDMDFTEVGVFKYVGTSKKVEYLRRNAVRGKLVVVPSLHGDILVGVTIAQLREAD